MKESLFDKSFISEANNLFPASPRKPPSSEDLMKEEVSKNPIDFQEQHRGSKSVHIHYKFDHT